MIVVAIQSVKVLGGLLKIETAIEIEKEIEILESPPSSKTRLHRVFFGDTIAVK